MPRDVSTALRPPERRAPDSTRWRRLKTDWRPSPISRTVVGSAVLSWSAIQIRPAALVGDRCRKSTRSGRFLADAAGLGEKLAAGSHYSGGRPEPQPPRCISHPRDASTGWQNAVPMPSRLPARWALNGLFLARRNLLKPVRTSPRRLSRSPGYESEGELRWDLSPRCFLPGRWNVSLNSIA